MSLNVDRMLREHMKRQPISCECEVCGESIKAAASRDCDHDLRMLVPPCACTQEVQGGVYVTRAQLDRIAAANKELLALGRELTGEATDAYAREVHGQAQEMLGTADSARPTITIEPSAHKWTIDAQRAEIERLREALMVATEHLEALEMCLSCANKGCVGFTDSEYEAVRPCPGHKHIDTLDAENITDTLRKIQDLATPQRRGDAQVPEDRESTAKQYQ